MRQPPQQDLDDRHTAALNKMEGLKRTVEVLQFEKELQKETAGVLQQLAALEADVRASAQSLVLDLRACQDVVQAETEAVRSGVEALGQDQRDRRAIQDKLSQV